MNEILIIICLILLNGVFAMSEVALISARKTKLAVDAKNGSRSAKAALELANDPDRFLSTVQIGITLIGILTGVYSGNKVASILAEYLLELGIHPSYASSLAQGVIVVIVTYLSIIFGELVPKRIGLTVAESVSKLLSRPMRLLSYAVMPFVWLLSKSTEIMFDILGIKNDSGKITEEEIKSIIQEGTETGVVKPVERDIVHRVFLMGDLKISSIMTHRCDMVWLDLDMTVDDIKHVLSENVYESYPVVNGDLDDVRGVVKLKDLVLNMDCNDFCLSEIMESTVYFHENMSVYKVLELMKSKHLSRALVCDEFGDCIGIVTLKDILEGFVGTIGELEEEPDIVKCVDGESWLVSGKCSLYDFLCYFGKRDLFKNMKCYTLGGLILNMLRYIPKQGEMVEWNGFIMKIITMDGVRIDKVLVAKSSLDLKNK